MSAHSCIGKLAGAALVCARPGPRAATGSGWRRAARVIRRGVIVLRTGYRGGERIAAIAWCRTLHQLHDGGWTGAAGSEQAQQTLHVGVATCQVVLVIVRGLREAGKQDR